MFSNPLRARPSLGPNIFLSTLFSNSLSLCFSLNAKNHVSHQYRTPSTITGLYVYCNFHILWIANWRLYIHPFIHAAVCLMTGPRPLPKRVLRSFLFQFAVSSTFLKVIHWLLTSSSSYSRHYHPSLYLSSNNVFQKAVPTQDVTNPTQCTKFAKYRLLYPVHLQLFPLGTSIIVRQHVKPLKLSGHYTYHRV